MGNAGIDYALVNSTFLTLCTLYTHKKKNNNNNLCSGEGGYVLKVSFNLRGGTSLTNAGVKGDVRFKDVISREIDNVAGKAEMAVYRCFWLQL